MKRLIYLAALLLILGVGSLTALGGVSSASPVVATACYPTCSSPVTSPATNGPQTSPRVQSGSGAVSSGSGSGSDGSTGSGSGTGTAAAASSSSGLAFTGADVTGTVVLGVALLGGGAALVGVSRRRRNHSA